jgi:hypothetical protein
MEHKLEFPQIEKVKKHVQKHKKEYIAAIGGAAVATITCAIVRDIVSQPIGHGASVTAKRGISVLGKKVVMHNVSYIYANRQGPPSWVVRCIETGEIFSSQNSAALTMELAPQEISKHLCGLMDHVRGYHFERICLAA